MTLRARRLLPWVVSLAATAASTYALDAVATAAGLVLFGSGVLIALGTPWLLLLLVLSYVTWGLGLRENLAANWDLLERTGISTNLLSKAAYELITARHADQRVRRWAASSGYVATELAKELPYYAGSFGATLVIDSVTAADAIVFLIGANLGAAAYEYGLACVTLGYLSRVRPHGTFSSAETTRSGSDWGHEN